MTAGDISAMVYVVDDDVSVRKSLGRMLRIAGYSVETFASAEEFLQRQPHTGPACLVLDIQMQGLNGLGLQQLLAEQGLPFGIVFITGHGDVPQSVEAMKGGAVDFLLKPFSSTDLLNAIERAINKSRQDQKQADAITEIRKRVSTLTTREHEVFSLVVQGKLNKQIARELGITEKTIKVHRARVMEKMQVDSLAELVRLAQVLGE